MTAWRSELVTGALEKALHTRRPEPELVFHSDRGSQYESRAHRAMLTRARVSLSMSAGANPYHNAWTESLKGTLKNETLQGGEFANERESRAEIFGFRRFLLRSPPQTLLSGLSNTLAI